MLTRTLVLVVLSMLMFAAGTAVLFTAKDAAEYLLAVVAIIGSLAVVLANVDRNGKP